MLGSMPLRTPVNPMQSPTRSRSELARVSAVQPATAIADKISNGEITVGVVGLGFVGSTTVDLLVNAGIRAVGYDRDSARVRALQARLRESDIATASAERSCMSDLEVIIVAVRLPPAHGGLDLTPLLAVADTLNALPRRERLVLLSTTVPPGVTRRFATEWLVDPCRDATSVVCCPERLEVGDDAESSRQMPRVVGALNETAALAATALYRRLGIPVTVVSSPEVAELSKLWRTRFSRRVSV